MLGGEPHDERALREQGEQLPFAFKPFFPNFRLLPVGGDDGRELGILPECIEQLEHARVAAVGASGSSVMG